MKRDDSGRVDGRHARRDRNRRRVLDAIIELIEEGDPQPTVAVIADRSGMSHRSVFRYFDDFDALFSEATKMAYERFSDLYRIHSFARGMLEQRIESIVEQRLALFGAIAPLVRAGRARTQISALLDSAIGLYFDPMRQQIAEHFATEFDAMPESIRGPIIDAAEALLSFDTYEFFDRHELDESGIRAAYRHALGRLLA